MTEAIIGLVGVLIGGLVSGGATYLLARRSERIRVMASARLLEDELVGIANTLESVLEAIAHGRTEYPLVDAPWEVRIPSFEKFSPALWDEHKGRLAETLSDEAWIAVTDAYSAASELTRLFGRERKVWEDTFLRDLLPEIKKGADALSLLAGTATARPLRRAPLRAAIVSRTVATSEGTADATEPRSRGDKAVSPDS
jgi:hypothetical protein